MCREERLRALMAADAQLVARAGRHLRDGRGMGRVHQDKGKFRAGSRNAAVFALLRVGECVSADEVVARAGAAIPAARKALNELVRAGHVRRIDRPGDVPQFVRDA